MDFLEQYWQKGGTYAIPVEIINQINGEFEEKDKEIERLNDIINESRRMLGEYKHFSTPTEQQNSQNEDIVDKVYLTLHENLRSDD